MARGKGYRDYTDYRNHLNGQIPPGRPVTREQRAEGQGHRGPRRGFIRDLRPGVIVQCDVAAALKGWDGQVFRRVVKWTIDNSGPAGDRTYVFTRVSAQRMRELIDAEVAAGAILGPQASLSQRALAEEVGS